MTKQEAQTILESISVLDKSIEEITHEVVSSDVSYNITTTQRWLVSDSIRNARVAFNNLKKLGVL